MHDIHYEIQYKTDHPLVLEKSIRGQISSFYSLDAFCIIPPRIIVRCYSITQDLYKRWSA